MDTIPRKIGEHGATSIAARSATLDVVGSKFEDIPKKELFMRQSFLWLDYIK